MVLDVVEMINQVEVQLVTNKHVAPKHHLKTVGLGDLGEVVVRNVEAELRREQESVNTIHIMIAQYYVILKQRQILQAVILKVAVLQQQQSVTLGDLGEVVVRNVEAEHINVLESVLDIHHIIVQLAHLIQRQIQEAVIQEDVVLQQQVVVVHHV